MAMKLINVNDQEFNNFIKNSKKSHFLQTSAWGEVSQSRRYTIHKLILVNDNHEYLGSALLLEKKILCYSTFYCPRGFICDYDNDEIIIAMIKALKKYVKDHHGLYLRIDPDIILNKLNEGGEVIENNPRSLAIIELFKAQGAKHKGFTIRFNEASLPRFTFRVSLEGNDEDILGRMHPKTRKVFKNGNTYDVEVYKGDMQSVIAFHETMKETARRKKLLLEPLEFFTNYYGILNKHDMSDIYCAKVNIKTLKTKYTHLIDDIKTEISELEANPSKKNKGRLNDLNCRLIKLEKELNEVNKINEEEIILSSVITAKFNDKVWLIHGGNKDILQFVGANYWLYYTIMCDAKKDGYKVVDFFGTEGKINPDSDLYGIYLFKYRFGGDFDEFIGEFDFITRPLQNKIIQSLLILRRKIKLKKAIKEVQSETN